VSFDSVTVNDDSDAFSAGDFTIYGNAGNITYNWGSEIEISSGDTHALGGTVTATNAGHLLARLELQDDDCDFFELCTSGIGPSWSSGSNSQADWATAALDLNTRNQDGAWHAASTTVNGPVGFTMHLSYRVIS
jgi:hypothetical protein